MVDLLLVDENDILLGDNKSKIKCHQGEGLLHRAFLVMIYDQNQNLLLTQRNEYKGLWAGYWDGSIASHVLERDLSPLAQKSYIRAAHRRIPEEIGTTLDNIKYIGKFTYKDKDPKRAQEVDPEVQTEYEICAILEATLNPEKIQPNPAEISSTKWIPLSTLESELTNAESYGDYTPWLQKALILKEYIRKNQKTKLHLDFTQFANPRLVLF